MTEKQRLLAMLHDNKITEEDFKILSAALDNKPSRLMSIFHFLINPFQKIAGIRALFIGITLVLLVSYVGFRANIYFVNILSYDPASWFSHPKTPYTYLFLLYQNTVCVLSLSLSYLLFAKIFKQKRLRVLDFFSTVTLAQLPYLIGLILFLWLTTFDPAAASKSAQFHPNLLSSLQSALNSITSVWLITVWFYALKESSGLSGNKLWISFIGSLVLAATLSTVLNMIFV